jgi:hypothetical protein
LAFVSSGGPLPAAAPPPKSPPLFEVLPTKTVLRTFPLKHIAAAAAGRVVRDLLGESGGARGGVRLSVIPRTNSLLVLARPPEHVQVAAILREIDREIKQATKIMSISGQPDEELLRALRRVYANRPLFRIELIPYLGSVVVSGDEKTVEEAVDVLKLLQPWDRSPPPAPVLEVRVFWIVSGASGKSAAPPEELKEVTAELNKRGLDSPRLAAQVSLSTVPDARFETSSAARLGDGYGLTVSGKTSAPKDRTAALTLELTVNQGARPSRRVVSLRTQATTTLGRPLVLGVTTGEKFTSAFVVRVEPKRR